MKKRTIALLIVFVLVIGIPMQSLAMYNYSNPGDRENIVYYKGAYDPVANPQKSLDSLFTTDTISVDGIMDAAYNNAPSSQIENTKELNNLQYAQTPSANRTKGVLRSVWDGSVLYLCVEVTDENPIIAATPPANNGVMTSKPAVPTDRDSVVFAFDLWNDKVVYETDTSAVFTIDSSGNLTYFSSSNIPSLGSVHADPTHPEYTNRIISYAASQTPTGYTVELALQIEGTELKNGTTFGVDVQICNVENLDARTVQEPKCRRLG